MLKKVVITNCFGECMEYAIDGVQAENPSGLIITSIDGLGPVKADINMMDLATTDGQLYNSARLSGRNIVIKALFTHASSIEEARLLSYKYFPIKKKLKFHIETDERIGETEGYVESNEPDIFSSQSGCQISILCENPYFDGGEIVYNFNDTVPNFKFAFGNESLDERLIKISENATSDTERELIYNGDIDTGVELNFSLPTDDFFEKFSTYEIEIFNDDDKTMKLDLSKMSTLVPNTSPINAPMSKCCFLMNSDRMKFLIEKPFSTSYYLYTIHNGSVYILGCGAAADSNRKFYRLDITDLWNPKWIELQKFPEPYIANSTGCMTSYNGKIYVFEGYHCKMYSWDETNGWREAGTLRNYFTEDGVKSSPHFCVLRNKLYFLGTQSTNYKHNVFLRWTGGSGLTSWTEMSLSGHPSSSSSSANDDLCNNNFIVYNDKIYDFRCNSDTIYTWDPISTEWSPAMNPPEGLGLVYNTDVVVYKNQIHLFGPNTNRNKHYVWDGTQWIESFDLPFDFKKAASVSTSVSDDDYIYFFSNWISSSSTYTEEANNIKLIENDQLVVNTNKGKKSVTLIRGNNEYNVLNILEKNPTWFELKRGTNFFSYNAEGSLDNLKLAITTNKWYEGV